MAIGGIANGYGLDNMRKRAAALGGTLEVHSDATAGTMIRVIIPLGQHGAIESVPGDQDDE